MASKNDIEIKVGVTGAKKSIDQLEKLFDAFRNSESAKNLSAHQVSMQQVAEKAANNRRLHNVRMMNLTLEQRKQNMSLKLEEGQINLQAKRAKLLGDAATLAEKEARAAAATAKSNADIATQQARAKAAPKVVRAEASAAIAKAQASEIRSQEQINQAYNRTAESVNRVASSQSRANQAATSALKAEIQLEATLENSVIRNNNQRIRGQILTTNLARATTKQTQDEQLGIVRTTKLLEALDNQRQKEADRIVDRAARIERQRRADERREQERAARETRQQNARGGIFSGLFSPQIAETISVFSRLSIAAFAFQQVIRPIADTIGQSLNAFSQYTQTMRTLETVTINTGTSFQQARELVNRFNDGLSDRQAVAAAVRTFSSMNIELDRQGPLIEAMRDGIVAMGGDVNEQLPLMALAIKRNSSELLDNMGITKNVDEMYKEYAKSIHKSVSALNQQEKDTAVMNGVLQELKKYSGIAKDAQGELTGQIARFNTNMHEMSIATGEFLSGPGATILEWLNTAVDFWGKLGKNQDSAVDSLSRQLKYTSGDIQKPLTGRETLPELSARNKAILAEINKNTAAGIRSDAPIMSALIERGLETLKAMQTIRNKEKAEQKKARDAKKAADEQSLKDDEIRVRILMAKDQTYEAEKLQARVNFANNQKTMSLKLATELFNAEMAQAERHHKEKQDRERKRAEEEAKRKETERKRAEREAREAREKAAEQAIGKIGTFKPQLIQADVGADFEQRRAAERTNIERIARARDANQQALADLNALDAATKQQSEETHDDFKKRREEIQKLIIDQQGDISDHQRELDKIDAEEKKQRIKETADFLESSYQVALSVLQGDFSAVFSVIGNTLKDSIIKSLSETEAVKGFVGSITAGFTAMAGKIAAALTGALTTAFTAIGAILTGPFAPLIIAVGALGILIAKTMGDASERAKKYAEDIKNLKDGIDKLLPKKELTLREQRQQKVAELETRRGQLLARLEKERKGTFFATRGGGYTQVDKGAIKGYENELGIVEQGIKDLGDVLNNDLNDPLSAAAIAAKNAADALELMTKRSESFAKVASLNDDLQDKIFNQTIDRLVQEGKITKEEGEKRKVTQEIIRERSDLVSKAYEESRGFMFGGGIGMSKGTFDAAFGAFKQGDLAGASAMLASIGVTENETQQVIQLFKSIEQYLTGKGASVNMPGSSPDKPMYTQVVNVRDFREAFPDSAYFRAPSVDTTRSLNANAVAYR